MEDQLEEVVSRALAQAIESGELVLDEMPDVALERPKDEKNGDWASTVALRVAKEAHRPPREIAQLIVSHIPVDGIVDEVSIAGPGFINFRLVPQDVNDMRAAHKFVAVDVGVAAQFLYPGIGFFDQSIDATLLQSQFIEEELLIFVTLE